MLDIWGLFVYLIGMENDKNNTPRKKRGKRMYDIYCCSCKRELTSEEVTYWKKARTHEASMKCYYCLAEIAQIMQTPLAMTHTDFGRDIPFSDIHQETEEAAEQQTADNSKTIDKNNFGDSGTDFLKNELNYDPNEKVKVQKTKGRAGPFQTQAHSEKLENSNTKTTKITAFGTNEDVSLTLTLPGDVPAEFLPLLENGLNKFLAVIINTMAFAPLHSSVMKPFLKSGPDDNFDPGTFRFPWNE